MAYLVPHTSGFLAYAAFSVGEYSRAVGQAPHQIPATSLAGHPSQDMKFLPGCPGLLSLVELHHLRLLPPAAIAGPGTNDGASGLSALFSPDWHLS